MKNIFSKANFIEKTQIFDHNFNITSNKNHLTQEKITSMSVNYM